MHNWWNWWKQQYLIYCGIGLLALSIIQASSWLFLHHSTEGAIYTVLFLGSGSVLIALHFREKDPEILSINLKEKKIDK